MLGAMGAVFQAVQMIRVIAPFPSVEGLRTDTKITASEAGILFVGIVIIRLFQSSLGGFS